MNRIPVELAIELRKAGFPRHGYPRPPECEARCFTEACFPDLVELIDACGDGFVALIRTPSGAFSVGRQGREYHIPEEAVARHWLASSRAPKVPL